MRRQSQKKWPTSEPFLTDRTYTASFRIVASQWSHSHPTSSAPKSPGALPRSKSLQLNRLPRVHTKLLLPSLRSAQISAGGIGHSIYAALCVWQGFGGKVMAKVDVNGPGTCDTYRFLKENTGAPDIPWNFGRYFLVLKSGRVLSFGEACDPQRKWGCEEVPPSRFEDQINRALAGLEDEL